jgi:hypothetical protein
MQNSRINNSFTHRKTPTTTKQKHKPKKFKTKLFCYQQIWLFTVSSSHKVSKREIQEDDADCKAYKDSNQSLGVRYSTAIVCDNSSRAELEHLLGRYVQYLLYDERVITLIGEYGRQVTAYLPHCIYTFYYRKQERYIPIGAQSLRMA